jgi:hypothetical protein
VSDVPAWIAEYGAICSRALGLEGWPIVVVMADCIDNDEFTRAQATSSSRALDGRIVVRRDIDPDDQGYITMTHEFLHLATVYQDTAVSRIIALLPRKRHAFARELWEDGLEPTIERLARALTPLLRAQLEEPKSE